MAGGVKRSALDPRGRGAHEAFGAREHFVGGAAREGEEENAFGCDALIYKMRDAIDERSRFAGAGSGDEQRSFAMWRPPCSGLARREITRRSATVRSRAGTGGGGPTCGEYRFGERSVVGNNLAVDRTK